MNVDASPQLHQILTDGNRKGITVMCAIGVYWFMIATGILQHSALEQCLSIDIVKTRITSDGVVDFEISLRNTGVYSGSLTVGRPQNVLPGIVDVVAINGIDGELVAKKVFVPLVHKLSDGTTILRPSEFVAGHMYIQHLLSEKWTTLSNMDRVAIVPTMTFVSETTIDAGSLPVELQSTGIWTSKIELVPSRFGSEGYFYYKVQMRATMEKASSVELVPN